MILIGSLSTRLYHDANGKYFSSMTATAHVTTFLSWGHGLQNASSQVETRGSNSGFFEEYSSYNPPPPSPRYESRNLIHLKSCFLRNKETKLNANLWQAFSTDYYSVGVQDVFTWFNAFGSTPVLRGRYKNQGHLVLKFPTTCMSLWNSSCLLTPQNREKKQIARLEVRCPFKIHHYIVCLACLPKH